MKTVAPLALVIAFATLSAPAMAQFQKPEDAVKYRKAALTVMANHFGRIGAMANGRIPFDAKVAADSAALVETMSKLPWQKPHPVPQRSHQLHQSLLLWLTLCRMAICFH